MFCRPALLLIVRPIRATVRGLAERGWWSCVLVAARVRLHSEAAVNGCESRCHATCLMEMPTLGLQRHLRELADGNSCRLRARSAWQLRLAAWQPRLVRRCSVHSPPGPLPRRSLSWAATKAFPAARTNGSTTSGLSCLT